MNAAIVKTGIAFALTVAVAYGVCTLFFWAFPHTATTFMNGLFHGMDFGRLQGSAAFSFGGFASGLAVLSVWAFVFAVVFGWISKRV